MFFELPIFQVLIFTVFYIYTANLNRTFKSCLKFVENILIKVSLYIYIELSKYE